MMVTDNNDIPPLYRLEDPHGSNISHVLAVGPDKALGYVTYRDINLAGYTEQTLTEELLKKGTTPMPLGETDSYTTTGRRKGILHHLAKPMYRGKRGGLFYAYDDAAMRAILDKPESRKTLDEAGWPHEPEAFIRRLHYYDAPPRTKLYDLISDCFGSVHHELRTDRPPAGMYEIFKDIEKRRPLSLEEADLGTQHMQGRYLRQDEHQNFLDTHELGADSKAHYQAQYQSNKRELQEDWLDRLESDRKKDTPETDPSATR